MSAVPSAHDRILLLGEYPPESHPAPMSGKRPEWTNPWIYQCQPVVTANQMGYVLRTPVRIRCVWNGDVDLPALKVATEGRSLRFRATSHFGMGILTIQFGMTFRTPAGIGLLVKAPPNVHKPGVGWLEGFVETDVLRRDFTFNLKMLEPGASVVFEPGEPIGCVLPYPVDLLGKFDFEMPTREQAQEHRKVEYAFALSRARDIKGPSQLYRKGLDAEGGEQRKPVRAIRTPRTFLLGERP